MSGSLPVLLMSSCCCCFKLRAAGSVSRTVDWLILAHINTLSEHPKLYVNSQQVPVSSLAASAIDDMADAIVTKAAKKKKAKEAQQPTSQQSAPLAAALSSAAAALLAGNRGSDDDANSDLIVPTHYSYCQCHRKFTGGWRYGRYPTCTINSVGL